MFGHARLSIPVAFLAFWAQLSLANPAAAQGREGAGAAVTHKHPPVVDPASAKCLSCHEEVAKARVRHVPVSAGCLSCHEFAKAESGQIVRLSKAMPELCLSCHAGLRDAAEGKLPASHVATGDCTTCHKPHGADLPGLLVAGPPQLCLQCHETDEVNKGHKVPVSRADCTGCHAPHGSSQKKMLAGAVLHAPFKENSCSGCHRSGVGTRALLRESGAALCYTCHADAERRFRKAGGFPHGAVAQGRCTGCHDPHLAGAKNLLRRPGPALCFECHAALKQKVSGAGAHRPAAEGCAGCHESHVGVRPKLLVAAIPALCLRCHSLTEQKPARPGAAPAALSSRHLGADLSKVNCVSCHDPHGSGKPHLLATGSVHEPFGSGKCGSCHAGNAKKLVARDVRTLCLSCHVKVGEAASKARVRHAAMNGLCTACHDPHAASLPKLVRIRGEELCTPCHEKQKTREGQVAHGATTEIGCQGCHMPHGGERPKLLRASGNDLCNGCHLDGAVVADADGTFRLPGGFLLAGGAAKALRLISLDAARERNHPVPGHLVSGKPKESRDPRAAVAAELQGREMSCLSCHGPHSGVSKSLFVRDIPGPAQLCQACHRK